MGKPCYGGSRVEVAGEDCSRSATLLLVDDNPVGLLALKGLLLLPEYRIETAGSGPEALEKAAALAPDLILLDVMMPGMDGFEVCRQIRSSPDIAEIPIVLVTALDEPQARIRGLEAGADDFLSKPVDITELRARVKSITRLGRYRKLVTERAKFEHLVTLSPDGILVVDRGGRILLANPTMARMLSIASWESLIGRSAWELLEPAAKKWLCLTLEQPDDPRALPTILQFDFRRADGTAFPAELTLGACRWQDRPALQIFARDVSERLGREEEAYHRSRLEAIGQAARGMAHDFKTYLAAVRIYAELLAESIGQGTARSADADSILRIVREAAEMIEGLLTFARDKVVLLRQLDLSASVAGLAPAVRSVVTEDRELDLQLGGSPLPVMANEEQIRQVVMNLVANAKDATPAGGTIRIRTGAATEAPKAGRASGRSYASLVVEDTGCGMEPEVCSKIFEPFFTTKERGGGTGLGMSIVYGSVRQAEGFIEVHSTPGHGTRVAVYLPQPQSSQIRQSTRP